MSGQAALVFQPVAGAEAGAAQEQGGGVAGAGGEGGGEAEQDGAAGAQVFSPG